MEDKILEVLVPTENVVEIRKGKKVDAEHKFFPGYILVKMELTDETWLVVKNTPRVSGFLGSRNKPQPISDAEVEKIINQMKEGIERPQTNVNFETGEQIRVIDGPFASFVGVVEDVDTVRGKLTVKVQMFLGREMPVEVDLDQVEKED